MQEVWALAGLREPHPNVLRYYGSWVQYDSLYILLEYANGSSLNRLLWRDEEESVPRPLPFHRVMQLFSEMCSALQYLHSHDMVHLDVKPANILLHIVGANLPPVISYLDRISVLDRVLYEASVNSVTRIIFKLGDLGHVRPATQLSQLEDGDGKYMPLVSSY